ncbi:hypothetical protein NKI63_22480 [Mesorhizobium sp. M0410]|uniref:hypothetical protein n=1 Tax=Mesorhizobium sp. M0410 TaxID=2956943 RepID=UPI00333AE707
MLELAFWHRQFPMFLFWGRLARFIFLSIGQFSAQLLKPLDKNMINALMFLSTVRCASMDAAPRIGYQWRQAVRKRLRGGRRLSIVRDFQTLEKVMDIVQEAVQRWEPVEDLPLAACQV